MKTEGLAPPRRQPLSPVDATMEEREKSPPQRMSARRRGSSALDSFGEPAFKVSNVIMAILQGLMKNPSQSLQNCVRYDKKVAERKEAQRNGPVMSAQMLMLNLSMSWTHLATYCLLDSGATALVLRVSSEMKGTGAHRLGGGPCALVFGLVREDGSKLCCLPRNVDECAVRSRWRKLARQTCAISEDAVSLLHSDPWAMLLHLGFSPWIWDCGHGRIPGQWSWLNRHHGC